MRAHGKKTDQHERLWVVLVSLGIVAFASLPYIVGYAIAPPGSRYLGFGYDFDDICVYLSWMRQAAEGHFFLQNLFTTESQTGHGFNLLFLALGSLARVTHLSLTAVFHLARITFGFLLLLAIHKFSGIWLKDSRSRLMALLMVGVSAGFGGYFMGPQKLFHSPMDLWQPEAITFLSIYFSPLFTFPMILMVGSLYFLWKLSESGNWKNAVYAGLMLFVLANVHTYDLVPIALTWLLYSAYKAARRNFRALTGGLLALAIASPMLAYQVYNYMSDPVFRARAAVHTLSPAIHWYLLGYGLLVPLAAICIWRAIKDKKDVSLLAFWAAAGLIAAYLPVPFQRKLIMGTHIPLAILGAIGLIWLADRIQTQHRNVLPIILIALMFPTNLRFLLRDIQMLEHNSTYVVAHAPYVASEEMDGLAYLKTHGTAGDIVLGNPCISSIIPGYTGIRVYCGHWGETDCFSRKLAQVEAFFEWTCSDGRRLEFVRKNRITYVIQYNKGLYSSKLFEDFALHTPPFLTPVFETELLTIYQVKSDGPSKYQTGHPLP